MSYKYTLKKRQAIKAVEDASRAALSSAALVVLGDAILRCPVDTGNLRSSLTWEIERDAALVGTNVEYAPAVEIGTSQQEAQPYLKLALDDNLAAIDRVVSKSIDRYLRGI